MLAFERIIEAITLQENFTQFTYSEDIHVIAQMVSIIILLAFCGGDFFFVTKLECSVNIGIM